MQQYTIDFHCPHIPIPFKLNPNIIPCVFVQSLPSLAKKAQTTRGFEHGFGTGNTRPAGYSRPFCVLGPAVPPFVYPFFLWGKPYPQDHSRAAGYPRVPRQRAHELGSVKRLEIVKFLPAPQKQNWGVEWPNGTFHLQHNIVQLGLIECSHNEKRGVGFHGPANLLHLLEQAPFFDDTVRLNLQ